MVKLNETTYTQRYARRTRTVKYRKHRWMGYESGRFVSAFPNLEAALEWVRQVNEADYPRMEPK